MAVNSINLNSINPNIIKQFNGTSEDIRTSFSDYLKDAIQNVQNLQNNAEVAKNKLITGETDDIASVMIAVEKSEIALQFTLAVRNKIMDAYSEIMRMQV